MQLIAKISSYATIDINTKRIYWTAEAWRGSILLAQCNGRTKADATRAALQEVNAPMIQRRRAA